MVELALPVGGVLNIQLSRRNNGKRWQARMVGYLEGESLLVTTPRSQGTPVPFYMDDEVTIRYLSGREIHGFTTWVRKVATQPFPYLHLAFPREIERVTIRQEERVNMELPCQFRSLKQPDVQGEGKLLDLSAGGALLATDQALGQIGEEIELAFEVEFAGSKTHIEVGATIRSVKDEERGEEQTRCLHGLQFSDLGEQHRLFVKGFVYESILQQRSS
ncbi:flagellar brake protein [Natronospira bacteriovora]|uniref:Flagellar brake protein n=1 Tax=Natronospira bacteriovora TaxID=3069753 RepID=A0ABU0W8C2_9GAMM|nr:flagellar brake protein [Natronospira sp. AB-CW4]MDQ2070280.1 flagellar brake protein [Natronospira sp. AB-CW4]